MGRFLGNNGSSNSFFLIVDDLVPYRWDHGQDRWVWDSAATYSLTAGTHQVVVAVREDGDKFDRLLLTNDPTFRPEGVGARCGDGVCSVGEDRVTCELDCDSGPTSPDAGVEVGVDGGGPAVQDATTSLYGCSAAGGAGRPAGLLLTTTVLVASWQRRRRHRRRVEAAGQ